MKSLKKSSLKALNSFAVNSCSAEMFFPQTIQELTNLSSVLPRIFYVLGEGSNTLFIDENSPVIIKPNFKGIKITETANDYIVQAGCSENWHELVCYCVDNGINGLENLALIPGSLGAAPVQNIGAYGVELSDFCSSVLWFDLIHKKPIMLDREDCAFAYRESIFKNALKNKGLIVEVTLTIPKNWQANLSYQGLNTLSENSTARQVMDKVIALRMAKLPDPKKLPNAGSFFKNPIVDQAKFETLGRQFESIPHYKQENGNIKLAAAWLIDQAGLKGYRKNGVGVHQDQALVLVNVSSVTGQSLVDLALYIQKVVKEKFAIVLEPEVRLIKQQGETNLSFLAASEDEQ